MPYTQVTLTGQVQASPGVAVPNAVVSATLSFAISDGSSIIEPRTVSANCDANGNLPTGTGALTIPANDDSTTVPTGSSYKIIVQGPGVYDSWSVIVPHASAPSVDLFSLARLGNAPPASTPYVVSIGGLSGVVTTIDGGNA